MQRAYAAHSRNPAAVRNASSGGVFSVLARQTLRDGGAVYGAAMDGGTAVYRCVTSAEDLPALSGSKYVFVPAGPVLEEIAVRTAAGQPVLAVVSPCQAAALRRACGDTDRLTVVDFVCHGAPDPDFLRKYLEERGAEQGSAVTGIRFRKKLPDRSWQEYRLELRFEDGTVSDAPAAEDPYMKLFLRNYSLRPACGSCRAKGAQRASDLTLGDFWGIKKLDAKQYHAPGTSLVFTNTPRGEQVWKELADELVCAEEDPEEAVKYNPSAVTAAVFPEDADAFRADRETMTVRGLAEKYCRVPAGAKAKNAARRLLGRFRK